MRARGGGVPWKEPRAGLRLLPIHPQEAAQRRGEHAVAVLLACALPDVEHHAGAVDVGRLQVAQCGDPQPWRRERRQDGAALEAPGGLQEGRHCGGTPQDRQGLRLLRLGNRRQQCGVPERDLGEEAQRTDRLQHHRPGDVFSWMRET